METFSENGAEGIRVFSEELINFVMEHPESRLKNHPSRLPGKEYTRWVELNPRHQAPVDDFYNFLFEVFEPVETELPSNQTVIMGQFTMSGKADQPKEYDFLYFIRENGNISASIIDENEVNIEESAFRISQLDAGPTNDLLDILQRWMQQNGPSHPVADVSDLPSSSKQY